MWTASFSLVAQIFLGLLPNPWRPLALILRVLPKFGGTVGAPASPTLTEISLQSAGLFFCFLTKAPQKFSHRQGWGGGRRRLYAETFGRARVRLCAEACGTRE